MKLRPKFLFAFTLILFIPLILIVWIIRNSVIQQFNVQAQNEVTLSLESVYRELEITKDSVRTKIDLTSELKEVKDILIDINKGKDPINKHYDLGPKLMEDKDLDILDILYKDGTIITSGHWEARFGYKDAEDVRMAQETPLVPLLRYEKREFETVLSVQVAKIIELGDESIIISGGIWIDQQYINKLARIARAKVLLVDRRLNRWIISDSRFAGASMNGNHESVDPLNIDQDYLNSIYNQTGKVDGNLQINDMSYSSSGISVQSGDSNFGAIIVAKSKQPLKDLISRIQKSFVLIALAGAILAWILAVIIVDRIVVSPIHKLAEGTREIASGNLDYRIPGKANDEIGELVNSFNRMTQDLQENKRLLIQAERMAAWQEIARRMAHEIKNPLFPIQLSIQTLQKSFRTKHPEFPDIFEESTTTILEEVESIKRILGEFNELSEMSKPILEDGDINDIVERSLSLYLGLPDTIQIKVNLQEDLPKIKFDKDQIGQVLKNLIGNAIDAMENGGTLEIRTYRQIIESQKSLKEGIFIEVSDTGNGIDEDIQNKIFTPYFTTKEGGTGLGLAIVYRILANHGGYITFASQPGKGTFFWVVLPVDQDETAGGEGSVS